ncbi:diacylglycerol O-acyltransferase 1 [Dimargaris cristalligena]|uniref:Diacylglycerol O-acyltransferase n=1 Tax=Dimargaris cristalligena TaxID=215637 RepID=A0A4P9ZLZ5_9FUNG|nr:diacylglycerol O-acyltransferase 1 [Dimargaris cristalligena]RKP33250.1 diacylglycerol acyltransferase [Dimargaris cristalligena]|eukprot:RKP33250.1 diacylglycerol acyltransferase [Dimargaris cristalligena]
MGVTFAPFNIPFERRRQTFCVLVWACLLPFCLFLNLLCLVNPLIWPLYIPYVIYTLRNQAPALGGRPSPWLRRLKFWKYCADYFPAQLVKEVDLDPSQNYIFGYHPHGIISVGALLNFGTEATGVSAQFPGLNIRLLTLTSNFHIPFYRDIILGMHVNSVSRHSIEHIVNSGPGNSCVIVVGGASESLYAKPKQADLVLKKRLGFIKLAIKNGASLVPIFTFGENDLYDQIDSGPGTIIRSIQRKIQSYCGFTTPLFHGRGIFNYDLGLMPFRAPLVSVVGRPIPVKRNPDPSLEDLKDIQEQYIAELTRIFNKYKDTYAKDRISDLRVVE